MNIGQLLLNASIPGREETVVAVTDLINNLNFLHVHIVLNKAADRSYIEQTAPDAVIVATGGRPIVPGIRGIESSGVVMAWDLLAEKTIVGKKVIILGGNAVGLETALFLAHQGTITPEAFHFLAVNKAETWDTLKDLVDRGNKEITVLEMTKQAGKDIGSSTRWTVMSELSRLGVTMITGATATEVLPTGVIFEKNGVKDTLLADSVVIAAGTESEDDLVKEIEDLISEVYVIGDAKEPRNALEAIKEGFLTGLNI